MKGLRSGEGRRENGRQGEVKVYSSGMKGTVEVGEIKNLFPLASRLKGG